MTLWVAAAALALSLLLPFGLLRPLKKRGVIDLPNERSSHSSPAVRGMGLAPLIAFALGCGILLAGGDFNGMESLVLIVVIASVAAAMLGFTEDVRGLRVAVRAVGQIVIGVGVGLAATFESGASFWLVPLFALGVAGYINVANFMDGIDGLSGVHGAIVGSTFAVAGYLTDNHWLLSVGSLLAVVFIGFLPWNLLRRGTFLGDVGSYFLGAVIAATAVVAYTAGVPLLALVAPVAIYLTDSIATVARRIQRGERWYEAHRTHLYQRLTDVGFSHVQSSLFVGGFTAISAGVGLVSIVWPGLWVPAAIGVSVISALYLYSGHKITSRPTQSAVHEGISN